MIFNITNEINEYRKNHVPYGVILGDKPYKVHDPQKVLIFHDPHELDIYVAQKLLRSLLENPAKGAIFSAGNTFKNMYRQIINRKDEFRLAMEPNIHSNLDELYPLDPDKHKNWEISFVKYMRERLWVPLGLDEEQWIIPCSYAEDPDIEALRVNSALRVRKWAICLLGIGPDSADGLPASSHIGFNMEGTLPEHGVRYAELDEATINANKGSAPDPENYPKGAITQGPVNIWQADQHILVAKGENKRKNIASTLLGIPDTKRSSSLISVISKDWTVALDVKAAGKIIKNLNKP